MRLEHRTAWYKFDSLTRLDTYHHCNNEYGCSKCTNCDVCVVQSNRCSLRNDGTEAGLTEWSRVCDCRIVRWNFIVAHNRFHDELVWANKNGERQKRKWKTFKLEKNEKKCCPSSWERNSGGDDNEDDEDCNRGFTNSSRTMRLNRWKQITLSAVENIPLMSPLHIWLSSYFDCHCNRTIHRKRTSSGTVDSLAACTVWPRAAIILLSNAFQMRRHI